MTHAAGDKPLADIAQAYVLGNGPTLPKACELRKLDGGLVVGINRILRSGYTPTVVWFNDPQVYCDDDRDRRMLQNTNAMVMCNKRQRGFFQFPGMVWVETVTGMQSYCQELRYDKLHVEANSTTAAAIWLLAMGVGHVQMLGCGCETDGARTHFYGGHPDPQREVSYFESVGSCYKMRVPLRRLVKNFPGQVTISDKIEPADFVAKPHELRDRLRGIMVNAGVEIG